MQTSSCKTEAVSPAVAARGIRRRRVIIATAIVVVAAIWYAFRPELLFINKHVNEAFPAADSAPAGSGLATRSIARGRFHSAAHETKGTAEVYEFPNGKHLLRLIDFATSNGPDVRVVLGRAADAKDSVTVKDAGYVDLGSLKGNIGDQNYEIPADVKLSDYNSVTIWCYRFSVNFGTAPLDVN